jgi:hypothetical protein
MRRILGVFYISCLVVAAAVAAIAQIKPASVDVPGVTITEMPATPLVAKSVAVPAKTLPLSTEAFSPLRTRPAAANGYLISTARTLTPERKDAIALTSLSTGQTQVLPFYLEGAKQIRLESATVTKDGDIVLAGWHETSNFLATLDISGTLKHLEDTGSYTPMRVCSASDGSLWTFGQDSKADETQTDYAMLQRRTAEGKLAGSFLPKNSLHAKKPLNYHNQEPTSNFAALACGDESVATYVGIGTEAYVWSAIDTSTGKFYQTIVPRIADTKMTGLALTDANTAYMSTPDGLYRLMTIVVPANGQHVSWWVHVGNAENDAAKTMGPLLGINDKYFVHFQSNGLLSKAARQGTSKPVTVQFTRLPD